MLRIGLLSDIHAHRHDQEEDVDALIQHINAQPAPDVLVCAGDISHHTGEVDRFLRRIHHDAPKCWVPGNHDVWVIDRESDEDSAQLRYEQVFPRISAEAGWWYLPGNPLPLANTDLAIVGSIGWFTGEGFSEWFDQPSGQRDMDLAHRLAEALRADVARLPSATRLIIVTHHVGHRSAPSHDPTQGNVWSSALEELIEDLADRVVAVLHGHRHVRYEPRCIDGKLFAAHPFGYPHQHSRVEDGYRVVVLPNDSGHEQTR
ncbi:MAG: hypothetical protein GF346_13080 [Candidatus Eisenbacteria bacterium]|nr:hypothetical protein [Candidatus Latescibacterota bacterium]MBD3303372.1 hypothetical protein [Candidatus Eisenbacteria bacterium]